MTDVSTNFIGEEGDTGITSSQSMVDLPIPSPASPPESPVRGPGEEAEKPKAAASLKSVLFGRRQGAEKAPEAEKAPRSDALSALYVDLP